MRDCNNCRYYRILKCSNNARCFAIGKKFYYEKLKRRNKLQIIIDDIIFYFNYKIFSIKLKEEMNNKYKNNS